jgi:ketosteroid isomerase-like protein
VASALCFLYILSRRVPEPDPSKAASSVDAVRASIDAWNRRDMAASRAATAPDAVLKPADFWPESEIRHGRDAMMEVLTDMKSAATSIQPQDPRHRR